MKIAIFSDVHSNLAALEAVIDDSIQQQVDAVFCLGDTIGYAAKPEECFCLAHEFSDVMIMGNHDMAAKDFNIVYEFGFNPIAHNAVEYSVNHLSAESKKIISALPTIYVDKDLDITLAHGSSDRNNIFKYIYGDNPGLLKYEAKIISTQLVFIGHTHVPFFFSTQQGTRPTNKGIFEINSDEKYVINVGSVGQTRTNGIHTPGGYDSRPVAWYGIMEIKKNSRTFYFRDVNYDFLRTMAEIKMAGLPHYLAERLNYAG